MVHYCVRQAMERHMAFLGTYWLMIWNDFGGGDDREYEAWIVREHMNDRMRVPGFLRGRRYVGRGSPRYLNMYEVDGIGTLTGGAYVSSLNTPSPWTRKMMPHLTNFSRVVCRAVANRGGGVAGHLASFRVPALHAGAVGDRDLEGVLDAVVALPDILGASIGITVPAPSNIDTAEKRLRAGERLAGSEVVVAIQAASAEALEDAMAGAGAILAREIGPPSSAEGYALSLLLDPPA
jgi:hypothetical protein